MPVSDPLGGPRPGRWTFIGRRFRTVRFVTRSFLLRLVGEPLADGRIAGHIQVIETGQVETIVDAEQLVAFLLATGHGGRTDDGTGEAQG